MRTDETSAAVVGDDGEGESRRRFREELAQIPTLHHAVYGNCLAPVYPSQLLIALGQLADLPIGAWRGQASIDWGLDSSLVRRVRQHRDDERGHALTESTLREVEQALDRARPRGGAGREPLRT